MFVQPKTDKETSDQARETNLLVAFTIVMVTIAAEAML